MKKFLKILALYGGILALLVGGVNYWYISMDKSDDNWTQKFQSVPQNIQICNFGSSHGVYGFNYEDLEGEFTCFNFALASQSLSYDVRILQQYLDKIQEGCIVFIPVSYFSFFGVEETQEAEFLSKNKQYYDFLSPKWIKEYDFSTHIFERFLPSLNAYEKLFVVLFEGQTNGNKELWARTAVDMDVSADAKLAYQRHLVDEKLDEQGKRIINEEEISALRQMISLCQEAGAFPILVTTPYLREYVEEIEISSPDFYREFYGIIQQIVEETGVDYIDYASDQQFIDHKDLFMNTDHLNKEGARMFTDRLFNDVKGLESSIN